MIRAAFLIMILLPFVFSSEISAGGGTIPKPNKIMVLGDSLTRGLYASSETRTFASLLATEFDAELARIPGVDLSGAEKHWIDSKHWGADLVIIEIGLNDVSNQSINETDWAKRYANLVYEIKQTGSAVVTCTMFNSDRLGHPQYDRYLRFNQYIRDGGGVIADLWTATEDCDCISDPAVASPYAPDWAGDTFHPNDLGHRVIADTIKSAMSMTNAYIPFLIRE